MSGKGLYSEKGGGSVGDGGSDRPVALALSDVSSLADRPLYLHEDELHRPLSTQGGDDEWADRNGGAEGDDEYQLSKHEVLERLRMIHSPAQLVIDLTEALSIKRPGFDVAVFDSQSFRCRAADESVAKVGLILKRVTCVDRRMYDIKVYELDTFMRFMNHPHVVSLYAMWNEPTAGPYAYKTLVGLYREGVRGDLYDYAVERSDGRRLRSRRVKLLACHIASALRSFHNCNLIHAGIRPKNIYIDEQRNAMVGEVGKVELDSLRYSHHLFSKLFIANAMEHKLAYWAPELLTMQQYGKEVDCWALGVTLFQMMFGTLPFPTKSEESFRDSVLQGASYLQNKGGCGELDEPDVEPVLKETVINLLNPNPLHRWTSDQALAYLQFDFAVGVQRVWRGWLARRHFRRLCDGITAFQAVVKGALVRREYAPSAHYQATAMAAVAAVEEVAGVSAAQQQPATKVREAELRELQAETDQLIGEEDLRPERGGSDSRRGSRVSSRSSSRGGWGSEAGGYGGGGGGGGNSGSEEEVARLQSLLQARDVQLQILMKMLAEADTTSVTHAQQIALLNSKLSTTLGGGGGAAGGAGGGEEGAAADGGGAVTAAMALGDMLAAADSDDDDSVAAP
jgi:uncharacterized membrane protein YgcG